MLQNIYKFYVHESYLNHAEQAEKAKLLVNTFLLTMLAAYSYTGISFVIEFPVGFYITLVLGTCYIFVPLLLRIPNQLIYVSNFYIITSCISTTALIYYSGGLMSAVAPWVAITPIGALLYIGRRSAWFWSFVMVGVVFYFGIAQYMGQKFDPQFNTKWLIPFDMMALSGFVIIAFLYNLIFESGRNEAIHIIKEKNKTLEEKQDEIQAQSEELLQQHEELKATSDKLQQQHELLKIAHHDIKSSINCALRIQQAILPLPEELNKTFAEYFVFYQPRDTVSGDIYWYAEVNQLRFLAMIDCTGHGVPGAFMTLIAHDLLNEIVKVHKILRPDLILNELRSRVIQELRQKESGNQDGMEISICAIDASSEHTVVQYASNATDFVYFQNGEMLIIKSDLIILGGFRNYLPNTQVTLHTIPVHTPTTFYMFSDGIQDQFGGKNNKKFTVKRLRQLLADIQHLEMGEQKQQVQKVIAAWQEESNEKQIDDMLLIGLRVS